ncbi:MAG TPA: FAD-dependent oxidoreductase [Steroidobacteraceae bacterium]|jgi:glycerol-3-phosphate dehydrogenase|nr:FAD-dependent oxidoreductase [Steroidobacteraceae bacterium]
MKDYDVVIIGGGIHGAGVLQAAAAAGFSALLIERRALASGTSSRSSKLIHGGLRYLESGQFALVRESLRERAIHLRIAAELVQLKPFFIPVYRDTRRRPWQLKLGLWLYALLGGFDAATRFGSVPQSEWSLLDGLKTQDLDAVVRYHDAQTNDALLTRAVVQSALALGGAELAMPATFTRALLNDSGVTVSYTEAESSVQCRARVLINAAGPWAPQVARAVEPAITVPDVDLVQGTHIVIPFPVTAGIYYVESPTDGRAVFVMPWAGATLLGTTETPYIGEPDDVRPLPQEEEYLLAVARHYFPALSGLTRDDIAERFAGLRVLPAATQAAFDRSRETVFTTDRDVRPRVLGIYGGKLTGWRAAAAHVMERIGHSLPASVRRAATEQLILRRPA